MTPAQHEADAFNVFEEFKAAALGGFIDIIRRHFDTYGVEYFKQGSFSPLSGALLRAANAGQTEIVNLLLDNGADIECRNVNGITPLISAVDHPQTLRALLDRGADVNGADYDLWTPLIWAGQHENLESTHLLLLHGADTEAKSNVDLTACEMAQTKGFAAIITALQEWPEKKRGIISQDVAEIKSGIPHAVHANSRLKVQKPKL